MSGAAMCLLITDVAFALGPRCILWYSLSELVLTSMEINQRDNSRDTAGQRFDSFQGGQSKCPDANRIPDCLIGTRSRRTI